MASEADCGVSTVLESHCVASTEGFPEEEERWAAFLIPNSLFGHDVSRPSPRGPPRQRHADWWLRVEMCGGSVRELHACLEAQKKFSVFLSVPSPLCLCGFSGVWAAFRITHALRAR